MVVSIKRMHLFFPTCFLFGDVEINPSKQFNNLLLHPVSSIHVDLLFTDLPAQRTLIISYKKDPTFASFWLDTFVLIGIINIVTLKFITGHRRCRRIQVHQARYRESLRWPIQRWESHVHIYHGSWGDRDPDQYSAGGRRFNPVPLLPNYDHASHR